MSNKKKVPDIVTVVEFDFSNGDGEWVIDLAVLREMIKKGAGPSALSFFKVFFTQAFNKAKLQVGAEKKKKRRVVQVGQL